MVKGGVFAGGRDGQRESLQQFTKPDKTPRECNRLRFPVGYVALFGRTANPGVPKRIGPASSPDERTSFTPGRPVNSGQPFRDLRELDQAEQRQRQQTLEGIARRLEQAGHASCAPRRLFSGAAALERTWANPRATDVMLLGLCSQEDLISRSTDVLGYGEQQLAPGNPLRVRAEAVVERMEVKASAGGPRAPRPGSERRVRRAGRRGQEGSQPQRHSADRHPLRAPRCGWARALGLVLPRFAELVFHSEGRTQRRVPSR
ncbi:hypothetical protein RKD20_009141 [Streptomyces sp. SLBN-8D4]|jgi:hypothetical protein